MEKKTIINYIYGAAAKHHCHRHGFWTSAPAQFLPYLLAEGKLKILSCFLCSSNSGLYLCIGAQLLDLSYCAAMEHVTDLCLRISNFEAYICELQ